MPTLAYCFTAFKKPNPDMTKISYFSCQGERTPSTHRDHWQGYLELLKQMRFKAIATAMGLQMSDVHFEKRRGTQDEAIHYTKKPVEGCNCHVCQKERQDKTAIPDTYVELGQKKEGQQGKRSDLLQVQEAIKEGKPLVKIADEFFGQFMRYNKGIHLYKELLEKAKEPKFMQLRVVVIWGKTNLGKTRACYEVDENLYRMMPPAANHMVWWDYYAQEQTLLLDDFYGWIPIHVMLNLMDGYPMNLQIKGGHTRKAWKYVLITSNDHPNLWYEKFRTQGFMDPAFERRIHKIIKIDDGSDRADIVREIKSGLLLQDKPTPEAQPVSSQSPLLTQEDVQTVVDSLPDLSLTSQPSIHSRQ